MGESELSEQISATLRKLRSLLALQNVLLNLLMHMRRLVYLALEDDTVKEIREMKG